ncbi:MAG: glycerophosphoryl diester phosphodiesterase membrane domain-containing protein, partial [Caldilineaceae bacterium]|nr:glycerophosphoryl diester phosphodiesterase membrane domain-containing protein [Caldilineaceae bacterium]
MTQRPLISGPLGLGDLLDRAFRLYRARFRLFLLTAAIFLIPFSLISGLLTGQFLTGYMDAITAMTTTPDDLPSTVAGEFFGIVGGFFGVMFVFGIAGLLINAIVALALTTQGIAALHEEGLTVGEGVRRGLRRFWSYIGMSIAQFVLIFLATLAVLIPLFILIFAVIFAGAAIGATAFSDENIIGIIALVLVIICGYLVALILAVAPGIYLSARWIVATPSLLAEELGALDALRRSWRLTKKQGWRVVGYLILLYLITFVVISLPVGLLQQVIIFTLPTSGLGLATAVSTAISSIVTVVWTPFYTCAVVLLYYDLRVRAEGYDLDLRVQQLESQIQPG